MIVKVTKTDNSGSPEKHTPRPYGMAARTVNNRQAPQLTREHRAPELHKIDDKWYIIFTGDPNNGGYLKTMKAKIIDIHLRHTFSRD